MEKNASRDVEFSLVDAILPLAEMWKLLVLLPVLAAGIVYLGLQVYPAALTYSANVHLPEADVRTILSQEALEARLAKLGEVGAELPDAANLATRIQISFSQHDETRLTLTLPRRFASPAVLGAITDTLRPEAEAFLATQRAQAVEDILLAQRTLESLNAGSEAQIAALEAAQQASPNDIATITALTQSLVAVANAMWSGQNILAVKQARQSELASKSPIDSFVLKPDQSLIVALAGGGMLLLVLTFIYVRQEFRFALSHDHGRQKVARLKQALRIFRGGKPTQP